MSTEAHNHEADAIRIFERDPWERVDLRQVHPDLVKVANLALVNLRKHRPRLGFIVTEAARTPARQDDLYAAGASQTLNSRHLPQGQASGLAEAIDIAATVQGAVRWDWPLYEHIAAAMKDSAAMLNVRLTWGGDWTSLRDGPHFELG